MQESILTERETEILHSLLVQRGITTYQIFDPCHEGHGLPGGTYPDEIQSTSGEVITPTDVYGFWLEWVDGHYTLGEEDGSWKIRDVEELYDKVQILQIQQQLRKEEEGYV